MKKKLGMIEPEPESKESALECRIDEWFYARRKPGQKGSFVEFCWFMRGASPLFFFGMLIAWLLGDDAPVVTGQVCDYYLKHPGRSMISSLKTIFEK